MPDYNSGAGWMRDRGGNYRRVVDISDVGTVTILSDEVTLTDAQIKAWPSAPIALVPAPAAGKALIVTDIIVSRNLAVAYTNIGTAGASAIFRYVGQSGSIATSGMDSNLASTTPNFWRPFSGTTSDVASADADGVGIEVGILNNDTGDPDPVPVGNFTGGDPANTITITVWYGVMDL